MITIDKNIPMPTDKAGNVKYPWRKLAIGDSFWVEGSLSDTVRSGACYAQRVTGFRFTCRKDGEGVRVWRTA